MYLTSAFSIKRILWKFIYDLQKLRYTLVITPSELTIKWPPRKESASLLNTLYYSSTFCTVTLECVLNSIKLELFFDKIFENIDSRHFAENLIRSFIQINTYRYRYRDDSRRSKKNERFVNSATIYWHNQMSFRKN